MKTKFTLVLALLGISLIGYSQCTFTSAPYSPNQPGISNFIMANISRTSTAIEGGNALVITGQTMTLTIGQTYSFSLTSTNDLVSGAPLTGAPQHCRIYVDFNNDLDFVDAGETAFTHDYITFTPTNAATSTYTNGAAVTVPATVAAGPGKLRVTAKMGPAAGHTPPTPCNSPVDPAGYHGEMEEYNVVFVSGNTNAVSSFSAPASACTSVAITMTNNSTGTPAPTFTWSTNPAATISNTSAAAPTITFSNAATYTITLVATNPGTTSTSSRTITASVCAGMSEVGINAIRANLAPNPFNQSSKLTYELEKPGLTSVQVYNILGEKVAVILNEEQAQGAHEVLINKSNFSKASSGIYFVELTSGKTFYREKIVVTD